MSSLALPPAGLGAAPRTRVSHLQQQRHARVRALEVVGQCPGPVSLVGLSPLSGGSPMHSPPSAPSSLQSPMLTTSAYSPLSSNGSGVSGSGPYASAFAAMSLSVPSAAIANGSHSAPHTRRRTGDSMSTQAAASGVAALAMALDKRPPSHIVASSNGPNPSFALPKAAAREHAEFQPMEKRRQLNGSPSAGGSVQAQQAALALSQAPSLSYYASQQTFRGEDVHHSSNASFNQQLHRIKERLREQRRAASSSSSAPPANVQGRDDLMLMGTSAMAAGSLATTDLSYTTRLIAKDREAFHAHSRSSYHASLFPTAPPAQQQSSLLPPFAVSNGPERRQRQHSAAATSSRPAAATASRRNLLSARSSEASSSGASDDELSKSERQRRRRDRNASLSTSASPSASPNLHSLPPPQHPTLQMLPRSRSAFDARTVGLPGSAGSTPGLTPASSPTASSTPAPLSSPSSGGPAATPPPLSPTPPAHMQQNVMSVRATGDLLRQRAAQAQTTREGQHSRSSSFQATPSPPPQIPAPPRPLYASPQSGTHFAMASEPPSFVAAVPSYLEPFYVCPDRPGLVRRLRAADEAKLARQTQHGCAVVYDSIDQPEAQDPPRSVPTAWTAPPGQLPYYYVPTSSDDATLVFESRFESGNLRRAIQVDTYDYDLLVRPDINTNTYSQWFMLSLRNTRAAVQPGPGQAPIVYKFNIVNLQKSDSLFNAGGMQPLIYSEKKTRDSLARGFHYPYQSHPSSLTPPTPATGAVGWHRGGHDIAYYKSGGSGGGRSKASYTLSFSLALEHDMDVVYIAYAMPHTVTMLYRALDSFALDPARKGILQQRSLCRTLAGNDAPLCVITDFTSSPEAIAARPAVVLSARVHPGESNASWIMKGVLEFLLSVPGAAKPGNGASPLGTPIANLEQHVKAATFLRSQYVFYLIPCLNPDGVVSGNYRTSLAGVDLNRQWRSPDRATHPTIFKTKQLMEKILGRLPPPASTSTSVQDEKSEALVASPPPPQAPQHPPRDIALFVDLHGHSRAQNVFLYGVEGSAEARESPTTSSASPGSSPVLSSLSSSSSRPVHRLASRVLPQLLSRRSGYFSLSACHYVVRKAKEATARVVVAKEMGIAQSFTLEASFGGVADEPNALATGSSNPLATPYIGYQFNTRMYEEMGHHLCLAIGDLATPSVYASARTEVEASFPSAASPTIRSFAASPQIQDNAGMEDSDDDGEAREGEGEVVRTKVRRKRAKGGKSQSKTLPSPTSAPFKRRARSKSSDGRRPSGSAASSALSQTAPAGPGMLHVRALLERLSKADSSGTVIAPMPPPRFGSSSRRSSTSSLGGAADELALLSREIAAAAAPTPSDDFEERVQKSARRRGSAPLCSPSPSSASSVTIAADEWFPPSAQQQLQQRRARDRERVASASAATGEDLTARAKKKTPKQQHAKKRHKSRRGPADE